MRSDGRAAADRDDGGRCSVDGGILSEPLRGPRGGDDSRSATAAGLLSRHDLPAPALTIECPGGAYGVARAPFAIPHAYQGRQITFLIRADATFSDGRGELLRFRTGQRAASARVTLTLPQGIRDHESPRLGTCETEIIWWPELLQRRIAA